MAEVAVAVAAAVDVVVVALEVEEEGTKKLFRLFRGIHCMLYIVSL